MAVFFNVFSTNGWAEHLADYLLGGDMNIDYKIMIAYIIGYFMGLATVAVALFMT